MLRFQIALAVILISCVAFVSCDRAQQVLEPVADDMMDTPGDMPTDMMPMMDMTMHKSWMHVMLPAPTMTVEEAAAAMNPGGTGAIHGMGDPYRLFQRSWCHGEYGRDSVSCWYSDCQGTYGRYQHICPENC